MSNPYGSAHIKYTLSRSLHSHVSTSVVNVQIAGDDSTAGGKWGKEGASLVGKKKGG